MAILCFALWAYTILIIIRVILSWVEAFGSMPDALRPGARVVYDLTEPVLGTARRYIPPAGMLDLSALIVLLLLQVVTGIVCSAG